MQELKEKFYDALDQIEPTQLARQAAALLPLLGIILPWITLDGETDSLTGAELLAYAFTSPERATMFQTSTLAGLTLFAAPLTTITFAILAFIKILKDQYPLALNIATAAVPIIMLATVQPITSTAQKTVFGFIFPDWGLALTIIPHLGLLAHGIWRQYYKE